MAPNIIDFIITSVLLKLAATQIPVQHYSNTRWAPPQYQEYSNIHYQDQLSPPPRYSDPAYIYHYPEPYTTPVSNYQSANSSPYASYTSSYAQPSAVPPVSTLTKPNPPTSPPLSSSAVSSQTPFYSQGMAPPYSTSTQTTSYANPVNPNLGQPAPSVSTSSVGTASKTSNSPVSSIDSPKSLSISNSPLKSLQTLSSTNKTAVKTGSNNVDSTVLNNLAIALQLLIVNNILKSPTSGEGESPLSALNLETESPIPFPPSTISFNPPSSPTQAPNAQSQSSSQIQPYQNQNTFESAMTGLNGYPSPAMTNANFLGSSNLLSPGSSMMGSPFAPQHKSSSNFRLMSPYEALTSSSEMMSSPFGSSSNFQSPYAALLSSDNNRDLFSMNDFL